MTALKALEKLANSLEQSPGKRGAKGAVALVLRLRNDKLDVLLVKRVQSQTDPWSGQIGFPGGKRDAEDQNLRQTVNRETFEEIGMDLEVECRFLGALPPHLTGLKPNLMVVPFVFLLEREPEIRLNQNELSSYFWIPLEHLIRSRGIAKFGFGEFPAFVVGNEVIWGLTYRILESLIRLFDRLQDQTSGN